jgi:hypothetical protein
MLCVLMQVKTLLGTITMTRIRSYRELRRLKTFEERWRYLSLRGEVGQSTFGADRYINQQFYTSTQWRRLRSNIIVRDNGCDLGIDGYEIHDKIIIHHMNPILVEDITHGEDSILDPEFLVTTTHRTHNAIHFGDEKLLLIPREPRRPGDTRLW